MIRIKKYVITLIIILSFINIISAQITQNNYIIGMSTTLSSIGTGPEMVGAGFSSTQTKLGDEGNEPTKSYGINFVPKVGYFILDHFALGLDLNFSYSSLKLASSEEGQSSMFGGLGCFSRYYVPISKLYLFGELDVGAGKALIEVKGENASRIGSSFYNVGCGLGLAFPLGDKATFDVLIGYDFIQELLDETYYGEDITSNIHALGIEMGVIIALGNKK